MVAVSQPTVVNDTDPDPVLAVTAGRGFDPTPYLRQIRGRSGQSSGYLDVRHRLLWLRTVHPDAQILTDLIQIDDRSAVFKASVTIPGAGSATGHGSESVADFGDFVEKAETKALGRALNALGFGVQFAEVEGDEPKASGQRRTDQRRERNSAAKDAEDKRSQEWKLFWDWARASGFGNPTEVEKILGRPINGLTPGDLQALLAPKAQGLGATA